MLYHDSPAIIRGITLFRDYNINSLFYYTPNSPCLAVQAGQPMFQLLVYRDIGTAASGVQGGGFLIMTTDLGVPAATLEQVRNEIGARFGVQATLAPLPVKSGTVRVTILDSGASGTDGTRAIRFVENVIASASPSLYAEERAAFTAELSKQGAALMKASLRAEGATAVVVVYDLNYVGLLPAYNVKITIEFRQSYEHLRSRMSTTRHPHDATDPLSIALTQLVSENRIPATGLDSTVSAIPSYLNGRVICASAGNLRGDNVHWQASIPAGGQVSVLYQPFSMSATSDDTEDGVSLWAYNEDGTTVRLRMSTRHSSNAVLATPEVPLMASNGANTTALAGGLKVNIHNGPERPNNRHFSPEVYWIRPKPPSPVATAPWIIRLRNEGKSACIIHGFAAYRDQRGRFVLAAAQTQPLIGVTYTPAQLQQFESHKIGTPGTAHGTICVAALTSEPGRTTPVGELAPFSSPGPLRAAAPGQRAIDVTVPGHGIVSARASTADPSRGFMDTGPDRRSVRRPWCGFHGIRERNGRSAHDPRRRRNRKGRHVRHGHDHGRDQRQSPGGRRARRTDT